MSSDPLFPLAALLPLTDPVTAHVVAKTTWTTNGPGEPLSDDPCFVEDGPR
jgi:hypothetical protein